jgi:hypothetical protein
MVVDLQRLTLARHGDDMRRTHHPSGRPEPGTPAPVRTPPQVRTVRGHGFDADEELVIASAGGLAPGAAPFWPVAAAMVALRGLRFALVAARGWARRSVRRG